ncbi:MAG: CbbX protein [Acidimicrobiales bacterium]
MTAGEGQGRSGFAMALPGSTRPSAGGGAGGRGGDSSEPEEPEEPEVLGDDDVVDLAAERGASDVDTVLGRLDKELVGLAPVKSRVREIAALLLVDRLRRRYGLDSTPPSLHMCFTGSPGTGKTTVALRMAELLHHLGYIRRNMVVSVTRDDLVGQYIGHTAPKTREVLKRAMGGVLFIDEAYYLYRVENERDYGQETIEILLQSMEKDRADLVVVLAGYKDRMDTFFKSNPGMSSRIAHHIDFPDYTQEELLAIGQLMLDDQGYVLDPEAGQVFGEYLGLRMIQPRFANARSVRNALERARLRQADRLMSSGSTKVTKDDLMRIEADDIRRSRVFDEADPTDPEAEADPTDPEAAPTDPKAEADPTDPEAEADPTDPEAAQTGGEAEGARGR